MTLLPAARRDPELAVLEGFHAVKHALRFGAEVVEVASADPERVRALAQGLAPDIAERLAGMTRAVAPEELAELAPRAVDTGVVAVARRPAVDADAILADTSAPVVLLENPRNLANLGACVRVAAAAEAAGVLTTGDRDPWHPDALRGSAGLHYAVPVARLAEGAEDGLARLGAIAGAERPAESAAGRPLIAIDPAGEPLAPDRIPAAAILAFGTERHGLSGALLARAAAVLRIPMRPGVSSLNLATAVAAVLYMRAR